MMRWNVAGRAKAAGIENANQLARAVGLSSPVAYRVMAAERVERIDVATVEQLAAHFKCTWWELLEHVPDKKK